MISLIGPARGAMTECYHNKCDESALNMTVPFASLELLTKVTQAMVDTVVDATDAKCLNSDFDAGQISSLNRFGRNLDASYYFYDKRRKKALVGEGKPYDEPKKIEPYISKKKGN